MGCVQWRKPGEECAGSFCVLHSVCRKDCWENEPPSLVVPVTEGEKCSCPLWVVICVSVDITPNTGQADPRQDWNRCGHRLCVMFSSKCNLNSPLVMDWVCLQVFCIHTCLAAGCCALLSASPTHSLCGFKFLQGKQPLVARYLFCWPFSLDVTLPWIYLHKLMLMWHVV